MNIGTIRKIIEGLPDNSPLIINLVNSSDPDNDLNVVINTIEPSKDRNKLYIHVEIVNDSQLRLGACAEPAGFVVVKLVKTLHHGERFAQEWRITNADGSTHEVTSDSEWGDVTIDSGGNKLYDIDGVKVSAAQIVACEISAVPHCTEDGDSVTVNAGWIKQVENAGITKESLSDVDFGR